MKLTGNRCQCKGCGEYFNSVGTFDAHRVGDWQERGVHRRCLSVDEMRSRSWLKNAAGFWIRSVMPSERIHRLPNSGDLKKWHTSEV